MATIKQTKYLIVGGGLSGLTLAAMFEQRGIDYLIAERSDWGGMAKGHHVGSVPLDFGLKSIPLGPSWDENILNTLQKGLGFELPVEVISAKTVDCTRGQQEDFLGFGDTKNKSLTQELNYYTSFPRVLVSGGWNSLIQILLSKLPEKRKLGQSEITKFTVAENKVVSVRVNGEYEVKAENVIWAIAPQLVLEKLPHNALATKTHQRLSRGTNFSAVSIDLATGFQVSDSKNLFLLGDKESEEFVLGTFIHNLDPSRFSPDFYLSQWLSLIPTEKAIDVEETGRIIKQMKKHIKAAFPQVIEQLKWERILVVTDAIGACPQFGLKSGFSLPELTNLYFSGAQLPSSQPNLVGALDSSIRLFQTLITPEAEVAFEKPVDLSPA